MQKKRVEFKPDLVEEPKKVEEKKIEEKKPEQKPILTIKIDEAQSFERKEENILTSSKAASAVGYVEMETG